LLLSNIWDLYVTDKRLLGYSKHTLRAYNIQFKLLINNLGDINITDVRLDMLKSYLSNQTHLKPQSLGHRIRFIRSLFRWSHDEGYITANPAVKLKEPKIGKRIPKALSEEDIELLREGCITPFEHALVEFLYTTGCRVGEVAGLNKNVIDWNTKSVIVLGKNDKEREVYFNVKCGIWLKRYLGFRKDTDTALFVTERAPHRMSISQIRYIIKRIAKRANISVNIYPHKLRHTYATHLLNNGAPLEVIQTLLGHEKLDTTRLYTHLSGTRRREMYQRYF